MEKIQKSLFWAIILSESSHVFCCVLPTLFSLLSLFAGLGVISTMPSFLVSMHNVLHDWEIPMIIFSGAVVVFGWLIHFVSWRIDCHDTGCVHGSCEPRKNRSGKILLIATLLFIANVSVYMVFHRGMNADFTFSDNVYQHANEQIDHKHHMHTY